MLAALRDGVSAAASGVKSEMAQMSRLAGSPTASPPQAPSYPARPKADAQPSSFRDALIEAERERADLRRLLQERDRAAQLAIMARDLTIATLRHENQRLRWEPRKARDGLVLLCVVISSAFTLVCFALFAMAERQLDASRTWEDQLQGAVLLVLGTLLLLGAVPLTHLSGRYLYGPSGYKFYQPGEGGSTYVMLQAAAWGSYGAFLMLVMGVAAHSAVANGVVTAAGVFGLVSQVLMVSSLLSFRPEPHGQEHGGHTAADLASLGNLGNGNGTSHDDVASQSGTSTAYPSESEETPQRLTPLVGKLPQGGAPVGGLHARRHTLGAGRRSSEDHARLRARSVSKDGQADGLEMDLWLDADYSWNASNKGFKFRMDTDTELFAAFMALQFSLVMVSLALGFIAESAAMDRTHRFVSGSCSVLLLVVAASLTHGLGGALSHRASWQALRPFAGGTRYLLLQGIVWALFGLCVASQVSFLGLLPIFVSNRLALLLGMPMTSAGLTAAVGHILLVVSISNYSAKSTSSTPTGLAADLPARLVASARKHMFLQAGSREMLEELDARVKQFRGLYATCGTVLVATLCNTQYVIFVLATGMFYGPIPFLCAIGPSAMCIEQPEDTFEALKKFSLSVCTFTIGYSVLRTFDVRGTARIVSLLMLTLVPVAWMLVWHQDSPVLPLLATNCALYMTYNWRTYAGTPELSGCREWHAFRERRWIWDVFQNYQAGRLVTDKKLDEFEARDGGHPIGSAASSVRQALCCYTPHGIFPQCVIWLPNASMFRDRFPGWLLTSMTATIIHLTPVMRDVAQWAGVRDVGRASVDHALRTGRSPMLVVGGQSEMFLSKSWTRDIDVHRRHRGFVRMAIRHGVPLIPIFAFGEHKVMDNVYLPRLQNWCRQRLGFPVPYLPYGRWLLPVPRRTPLTICVGAPVFPRAKTSQPSREEIDELHARYFDALEEMFERNKARCGFPDARIAWAT